MKDRVAQWMAMRAVEPGITNAEVARRLGIAPTTLNTQLYRAGKLGLLKMEDSLARIEHEIIPKAIDNLSEFLDQKDKAATLETVKGTAFPAYRESTSNGPSMQPILALKIETVDPGQVKIVTGHIVGKPRELSE